MKIVDERETQKRKNKTKNKHTEKNKGVRSCSERVRAKWFFCAFKVGFLQLICKASLIFKSNLELALLIVLKQRELYESKHVAVECRYLKLWDLLSFFGETSRHFKTRMEEHIKKDNKFQIFKHYTPPQHALTHNSLCFKIIDKANSNLD